MTTLVLGAGIAGINAARTLADAGRDVMVLEARDRIGGRVFTTRNLVDGVPVELGAEFLHGEKVPQWEIVRELGLRTKHWEKTDDS
ncbi:MAG: FAD-dependent oxidoreductase, partial [Chloroflexota bacterium]